MQFYIILIILTATALIYTKYKENINSLFSTKLYVFKRLIRNYSVKNKRINRIAGLALDKYSKTVLLNKYSLNEYLSNDENREYITRFKIRYYKTQLKALKQEIQQYLKFTNNRISVEHVIMLQEIKQKLTENGYKFKHKAIVSKAEDLENIRQAQIKDTIRINYPNVPVINNNLKEIYKNTYLKQHCLENNVEVA